MKLRYGLVPKIRHETLQRKGLQLGDATGGPLHQAKLTGNTAHTSSLSDFGARLQKRRSGGDPSKSSGLHSTCCLPAKHDTAGKAVEKNRSKKCELLALDLIALYANLHLKNERFFRLFCLKRLALTVRSAFGMLKRLVFQKIKRNFIKQSGSISYTKSASSSLFLLCFQDCGADI